VVAEIQWPGDSKRALALAAALASWTALLCALRFGVLEVSPDADPCLADATALACRWRAMLGTTIHFEVFGIIALSCSVLGWLLPASTRRRCATATLFLAATALVLYNVRYGAPAAVLALLACVRDPSRGSAA
jgi:hypothetical protein